MAIFKPKQLWLWLHLKQSLVSNCSKLSSPRCTLTIYTRIATNSISNVRTIQKQPGPQAVTKYLLLYFFYVKRCHNGGCNTRIKYQPSALIYSCESSSRILADEPQRLSSFCKQYLEQGKKSRIVLTSRGIRIYSPSRLLLVCVVRI